MSTPTMAASTPETIAEIGRTFYESLVARDWSALRRFVRDDATWTLPGDNLISGCIVGGDAVVEHLRTIAGFGVHFKLDHIVVSRQNVALLLHNTGRRGDVVLDEHVATVCRLEGGRIAAIETYLSDVPGMNAFFVRAA
ncbi:nuclear transport factor 2 family protein [Pendulispora rubella]|uniref:Nuclear transport factor 2 family protein n=1 Tax=Pendulispora rubella TaxID=2741070 RepID=A0ABZ2L7H1_9BACT